MANNQNLELVQIRNVVKKALEEHNLIDQVIIENKTDGFMIKMKFSLKQEKINKFNSLAGSAISTGENIKQLLDMANRKEIE